MSVDDALTEKIIGCAFKVANTLGPGFLEKVYENALAHELRKAGISASPSSKFVATSGPKGFLARMKRIKEDKAKKLDLF